MPICCKRKFKVLITSAVQIVVRAKCRWMCKKCRINLSWTHFWGCKFFLMIDCQLTIIPASFNKLSLSQKTGTWVKRSETHSQKSAVSWHCSPDVIVMDGRVIIGLGWRTGVRSSRLSMQFSPLPENTLGSAHCYPTNKITSYVVSGVSHSRSFRHCAKCSVRRIVQIQSRQMWRKWSSDIYMTTPCFHFLYYTGQDEASIRTSILLWK